MHVGGTARGVGEMTRDVGETTRDVGEMTVSETTLGQTTAIRRILGVCMI